MYHVSRELLSRGYAINVFTSDLYTEVPFVRMKKTEPSYNGVPVRRFRAYSLGGDMHYLFIPSMMRALLKGETDIIHTHSYGYFQSNLGAFTSKMRALPLVITPHFHPPWSMWGGRRRKQLRRIYDMLFAKRALDATDIVICHTQNEQNLLSRFSIPEEKIRIVPAGIDFSRFESIPPPDIFKDSYDLHGKIVLYAGRLASNKGLAHLMSAAPGILAEFKDTTFVFIGEDEGERKSLEKRAGKLGISHKVLFTGHIKDDELFKSAFSACDVFVLPSEYEAFGIVLLEAMACEKPCVATNVGGVPEVVEGGKTGLLVDYGNPDKLAEAIAGLLGDEKKSKSMGRAGRERVRERFTWPKVVGRLEEVYRSVVD
ncbi:MAG: glycosyltransferase family 4 protein [Thermoplasmata archaeon]|nr:MAG: glycosyltransferase family 4 protein [Thermoplasmata archaeon]